LFGVVLLWNDIYLHYFHVEKKEMNEDGLRKSVMERAMDRVKRGVKEVQNW
jgi:hypothetical protein